MKHLPKYLAAFGILLVCVSISKEIVSMFGAGFGCLLFAALLWIFQKIDNLNK